MDTFEWKPVAESWKGVGIYLLTCTVADRRPLLGILNWDGQKACICRTWLGNEVVEKFLELTTRFPQMQCLAFQVMPDHFHGVLYVKEELPVSIRMVVRGFRQGCSKKYREYLGNTIAGQWTKGAGAVSVHASSSVETQSHCGVMPGTLFTDYHLRSLAHKGQLQAMIAYVHDNPRRLAAKRANADRFRVRRGVRVGGMTFDAVGNVQLLERPLWAVHCRRVWSEEETRTYQNRCILAARRGAVLVGAFISKAEKAILTEAQKEQLSVVHLVQKGFPEIYKPFGKDFDACAAGLLLQLAPWPFDGERKAITREQCQRLNLMAETIALK